MIKRWFRRAVVASALMMAVPSALAASAASDFTLRDINGQSVNLAAYKGKVIVLSFWATWCGPCKEEMPHLQKMYDAKKDDGFVLLSISSDDARTASRVKPYIKSKGYNFQVLLDRDSSVTGIYNPQKTLPWTVVIDREFNVAKIHSGYNPGDEVELEHIVDNLLAGKPAEAAAEVAPTEE